MERSKIIEKLNNKNWSIVCERLQNFISKNNCTIEDVKIIESSDYNFINRNHNNAEYKNIKICENIGVKNYGGSYAYLYACLL